MWGKDQDNVPGVPLSPSPSGRGVGVRALLLFPSPFGRRCPEGADEGLLILLLLLLLL